MAAWKSKYKVGAGLALGAVIIGIRMLSGNALATYADTELEGEGEHAFVVTSGVVQRLPHAEATKPPAQVRTSPFVDKELSSDVAGKGYGARVIDAQTKEPIVGAIVSWQKPKLAQTATWEVTPGGGKTILGGIGDHRVPALNARGEILLETRTQSEGRFILAEFPKAYAQLAIQAEGYAAAAFRDAKRFIAGSRDDIIELHPEQWLELEVVDENLQPVATMRNDFVILRIPVDAQPNAWHEVRLPMTEPGRMRIPLDRRETVRLEPHLEGFKETEGSVLLTPGRNVRQLVLARAPGVAGTIVNEQGTPVDGARVTVHSKKSVFFRTMKQRRVTLMTNAQGQFRSTVAGPDIEITVDAEGYHLVQREDCKPGDHELTVTLRKFVGGSLTGRIVDHTGRGIASVQLVAHYTMRKMPDFPQTLTSPDGRFRFERLPPGELRVVYSRSAQGSGSAQHRVYFDVESAPLQAVDEATVVVPEIVVVTGGTIEGKVLGIKGRSHYARIELFRVEGVLAGQPRPLAFIRPNEKGEFSIEGVPEGRYGLMQLWNSEVKLVQVTEGATHQVTLGGAKAKLEVTFERDGKPIAKADVALAQVGGKLTDARITTTDDSGQLVERSMGEGTWLLRVVERATGAAFFGQVQVTAQSMAQVIQWPTHALVVELPIEWSGEGRLALSCRSLGDTPLKGVVPSAYLLVQSRSLQTDSSQAKFEGLAAGEYELIFHSAAEPQRRIVVVGAGTAEASFR